MCNLRKKLSISIICVLLTITTLLGSTYAWFTDSVSNTGNKIQAGTLDVTLSQYKVSDTTSNPITKAWVDIGDSIEPAFNSGTSDLTYWEPGYSKYGIFKISNTGNLAFEYKLNIVANETSSLNDVIDVYAAIVDQTTAEAALGLYDNFKDGTSNLTKLGTLTEVMADKDGVAYGALLIEGSTVSNPNYEKVKDAYAIVVLHMQEEAGNDYQDLSASFDIELEAKQYTYEEDGFGNNEYDENALYNETIDEDNNPYLTFSSEAEFTLGVSDYYYAAWSGSNKLESSTNLVDWTDFKEIEVEGNYLAPSVRAVQNAKDGKYYVYLRGTGKLVGNDFAYDYTTFTITNYTKLVDCSGNIMTLLNYADPDSATLTSHAFYKLFQGCTALKSGPTLPATDLADYCYGCLFKDCTSLIEVPDLPATNLASGCYACMFSGCFALTTAPKIMATVVADNCYREMFSDCTSLYVIECANDDIEKFVTIPSGELPYNAVDAMFYNTPNASTIGTDGIPVAGKSYKIGTSN